MEGYGQTKDASEFMFPSTTFQTIILSFEKRSRMSLVKGIPQGCGLDPIIFNIFMNNVIYYIEQCDFMTYAVSRFLL